MPTVYSREKCNKLRQAMIDMASKGNGVILTQIKRPKQYKTYQKALDKVYKIMPAWAGFHSVAIQYRKGGMIHITMYAYGPSSLGLAMLYLRQALSVKDRYSSPMTKRLKKIIAEDGM